MFANLVEDAYRAWRNQETDLKLSTDLLSEIALREEESAYTFATLFYYRSLRNAAIIEEHDEIVAELERMRPLLPDSEFKAWMDQIESGNRRVLTDIYRFWQTRDPFLSTGANERLIEHWQRIQYAREHYSRKDPPTYDIDDRGFYHIKLGKPDRTIKTYLRLNSVIMPGGEVYRFGSQMRADVELWNYRLNGEDVLLLFSSRDGSEIYHLRRNIKDIFDTNGTHLQFVNSGRLDSRAMRKLVERVLIFGTAEQLSYAHDYFEDMFQEMMFRSSYGNSRFSLNMEYVNSYIHHQMYRHISRSSEEITSLVNDDQKLQLSQRIYRFLDNDNRYRFLLVSYPLTGRELVSSARSAFISTQLAFYDENWDRVAFKEDLQKMTFNPDQDQAAYQIKEPLNTYDAYFSTEVIDTSLNNIQVPGRVNSKTSAIVATSGKKRIDFPEMLDIRDTLLVSDIVLGSYEEGVGDLALPIRPNLLMKFGKGSDIDIYFEIYNIPPGGYAFEYYLLKQRWLLKDRKVKTEGSITVLNDQAENRDSQLFSITLPETASGSYELVFEFRSLNTEQHPVIRERKIELEIGDE
ncbi:MAG: GWxTD domain-containing protein [Balneolaceae bacterium]|nr:GWxTD domain-containing protein [Balneolaceae bacterium]